MTAVAAPQPRLTGGFVVSVALHGGLVAAFILARPPMAPPPPQMIMVHTFAAPAGDRALGVVQPPTPAPAVETPPKAAPVPKPKPVVPNAKVKPAPVKAASAAAPPKPAETKPAPAPTAAAGVTGGRGADQETIDTPGLEFPYPWYTTGIVNALIHQFGEMNGTLKAEVRFVIKRDGTVDPATIKIVTSSGNYSFDNKALSAVEVAANAKAFGALPPGFREDILPVTFWFTRRGSR